MREVPLHGKKAAGRVALVDDADYELVMQYRWRVHEAIPGPGRRLDGPYAVTNLPRVNGKKPALRMHVLITGIRTGIDHENHNGLDNQRHNLRRATRAENGQNRLPNLGHTSQYRGVCWYRLGGKWQARIKVDGRERHLGYFEDEEDAADAYDTAALAAWGSFAYLNNADRAAVPVPPRRFDAQAYVRFVLAGGSPLDYEAVGA